MEGLESYTAHARRMARWSMRAELESNLCCVHVSTLHMHCGTVRQKCIPFTDNKSCARCVDAGSNKIAREKRRAHDVPRPSSGSAHAMLETDETQNDFANPTENTDCATHRGFVLSLDWRTAQQQQAQDHSPVVHNTETSIAKREQQQHLGCMQLVQTVLQCGFVKIACHCNHVNTHTQTDQINPCTYQHTVSHGQHRGTGSGHRAVARWHKLK